MQMSGLKHLRSHRFILEVVLLGFLCASASGQTSTVHVPTTTPLSVQLTQHVPMKVGEPLEGRLLYPIYVDNQVAIPAGSVLRGTVTRLESDRSHRIHSRLRGDFTPFHTPVVHFEDLVLPDGAVEPIASDSATDGVPILRLSPAPGQKKGSLISRQIAQEKQRLKDAASQITAPGRGDRLVQFLYTQLPYHPERIDSGTAWTVNLAQPLAIQVTNAPLPVTAKADPPAESSQPEWRLHAYLQQTISSANRKPGDSFEAMVSEPIFDSRHEVVVPQGSQLVGEITRSKPAKSFGRQGKLRFHFRELKLPSGFSQPVEGTLVGVDANKSADLQIDSEGGIAPRPQNRVVLPLVLTFLAGRAFDDDGSQLGHSAVASNGFGIVGRIVGIAASSKNVAAGIGFYGAALAFYDLWLAHGKNVVFVKNTRIDVTTTPGRNQIKASTP
jgi:hypothetical protein